MTDIDALAQDLLSLRRQVSDLALRVESIHNLVGVPTTYRSETMVVQVDALDKRVSDLSSQLYELSNQIPQSSKAP